MTICTPTDCLRVFAVLEERKQEREKESDIAGPGRVARDFGVLFVADAARGRFGPFDPHVRVCPNVSWENGCATFRRQCFPGSPHRRLWENWAWIGILVWLNAFVICPRGHARLRCSACTRFSAGGSKPRLAVSRNVFYTSGRPRSAMLINGVRRFPH